MTGLRISFETDDIQRGARASQEALRALGAQARQAESDLKRISDVELRVNDTNNLRLGLGPDPLGIRDAITSANAMLAEFEESKRRAAAVPFGAGIGSGPGFGAGLGGAFTAAELGLKRVTDAEAAATVGAGQLTAALTAASSAPDFSRQVLSAQRLADATQGAAERSRNLFNLQSATPVASSLAGATSLGTGATIDARGAEMLRAQGDAYGRARVAAGQYGGEVQRTTAVASGAIDLHLRSIVRLGGAFLGFQGIRAVADDFVGFDKALIGVSQATGLSGPALDNLRERLVRVSLSGVPILTEDLLAFGEAAGRLQIRSPEGIEKFVRDIAQLRTIGPDIGGGAGEVGDSVGRFLRLVGEAPSQVQPLTDSIARLDDEFGTSGNTIFATGEQVARAGSGFIRSSADALGLGAAMASLGIDGGEAGQVIAKLGVVIQKATREGGEAMRTLAELTGLTGEEIKKAFKDDSASLIISLFKGLAGEGENTARALDDLGLAEARQARAMNPLIQNYEQLARGVEESREAQRLGTDAARDAAQVQDSLASRLAQTRNIITALGGANQGLAGSLSAVVGFGNQVAAEFLGVADGAVEVSAGAELAARALQAMALAAGAGLVVTKLSAAYTTLTSALVLSEAQMLLFRGAASGTAVTVTGLAAAGTRLFAALSTPLGAALAIGGIVAGISALDDALNGVTPKMKGIAGEFREIEDDSRAAAENIDKLRSSVANLDSEISQLQLGKALQLRGIETGNTEDQVRGIEQQADAYKNAALKLRVLEGNGGGLVDVGELRKQIPQGSIVPDIDIDAAKRGVQEEFRKKFETLGADGKLREALEGALAEVGEGLTFRFKPGIEPQDFAESFRSQIDDTVAPANMRRLLNEISRATGGKEVKDADKLFESLANSIEVARVPARGYIEDLEAIAAASEVNAKRVIVPAQPELKVKRSDFFVEESKRIRDATRDAELAMGQFTQQSGKGLQVQGTDEQPAVLRGIEARKAALMEERRAQEEVIQARLDDPDPERRIKPEDATELRVARDRMLATNIAALELTEGQRVLGVESEQLSRSSSILGKEIENLGLAAGRDTAQSFALMREQVELTHEAEKNRIAAKELQTGPTAEIESARKQADSERDAALAGITLRESLAAVAEETRGLETEQTFLSKSSSSLGDRLSLLSARGLGETSEAFELMREQAALAREEVEKGIQAKEIQPGADRAALNRDRSFADDALAAANAAINQRQALAELAEETRRGQVQQGLMGQASGILNEQLGILGDRARGDTTQAFALMRQQIELARASAEIDINAKERESGPSDEIEKARELVKAQHDVAVESLRTQEALSRQRREYAELGQAASSFSSAAVDALFNIQDPADAARQAILEIGRAFIQPRLEAGFLNLFGDKGKEVAAQKGLGDLVDQAPLKLPAVPDFTLGPRPELVGSIGGAGGGGAAGLALPAAGVDLAARAPEAELGIAAGAAVGGIEQLGLAAQIAAGQLEGLQVAGVAPGAQGALGVEPAGVTGVETVAGGAADGALGAGLAAQEASVGLTAAGASGELAAVGMGGAGEAATLAALGLGKADVAALALVAGFQAALQAALQFTAGLVTPSALSGAGAIASGAIGGAGGGGAAAAGAVVPRALGGGFFGLGTAPRVVALAAGGVVAGGAGGAGGFGGAGGRGGDVQALGTGGMPTVSNLSGQVVGKATYALIGEGSDREGVFPLDPRGGVRARGPRGESFSLPLARDAEGKLGVTIDSRVASKVAVSLAGLGVQPSSSVRALALGGAAAGGGTPGRHGMSTHVGGGVHDVRVFALGGPLGMVQPLALGDSISNTGGTVTHVDARRMAAGGVFARFAEPGVRPMAMGGTFSARVEADVRPLALGGMFGSPIASGDADRASLSSPAASAQAPGAGRTTVRVDGKQSRTVNFYSTVNIQGQRAPMDAGMRYSQRQGEQNIRSMLRQFA